MSITKGGMNGADRGGMAIKKVQGILKVIGSI